MYNAFDIDFWAFGGEGGLRFRKLERPSGQSEQTVGRLCERRAKPAAGQVEQTTGRMMLIARQVDVTFLGDRKTATKSQEIPQKTDGTPRVDAGVFGKGTASCKHAWGRRPRKHTSAGQHLA